MKTALLVLASLCSAAGICALIYAWVALLFHSLLDLLMLGTLGG